jgi:hypothetical protein
MSVQRSAIVGRRGETRMDRLHFRGQILTYLNVRIAMGAQIPPAGAILTAQEQVPRQVRMCFGKKRGGRLGILPHG